MPTMYLTLLAVALGAAASPLSTNLHDTSSVRSTFKIAPLLVEEHPHGTVNNSYIVMLKPQTGSEVLQNHMNFVQLAHQEAPLVGDELAEGLRHVYDGHVKGYAGMFNEAVVDRIRQLPEVDYVERDQIVRTLEVESVLDSSMKTQNNAPWGLARVSYRKRLSLGTFTKYVHDPAGGEGVDVYVIDTGINIKHEDLEGRASWGKTLPQNDVDEDKNGHGTHCAGTIASKTYGIAKAARVIAVKVLGSNGSGTMSDVVAGVMFASESATAKAKQAKAEFAATGKTSHKGSVANMSLGGGQSRALNDAVNSAVDEGLNFAVAAGNDDRDACNYSPAAAESAVTVGASTITDERAYFSNHGKCVDVFAPGLSIKSTYIGSTTATTTMSGTSMASPHTAGLMAYLLSIYPSKGFNPEVSPDLVPPALSLFAPSSFTNVYAMAHAALPSWMVTFLPPPSLIEEVAPVPKEPPTLTPKQLKKALLNLATPNVFAVLPKDTVNLLIFNNATS
ncbi:uncharacterized protein PHACADRAFT_260098 [Phanerochaete carnosa HHB-10118-sp]|uniref:Peptidase S8/S53 domain-containing protein n=1 Tax=Phanerochaete carnosa (strain HHB-10118-sp) TaxID=650164 RepID=K5VQ80_PHACS|nr:uncharacterized protein PHACADRAFT_260098 [Phanerochaete carnosa HHB-10118-sp]EKM53638.1 hypothetical protein PHACADRAFT_260098 [Phanerochaete carnosa HHB-10118-sp]